MPSTGRLHRAITLVPLAVLSAAWTASLAGVGSPTAASADRDGSQTLPDGTSLPAAAIQAPASVGDAVPRDAAIDPGSASSIPQAALSAYQRAESVINEADPGCRLPWELVAAIGRVESDHGRVGGSALDLRGVARPAIYGVQLDGSGDTQRIVDTDGGQYDGDARFDRAVGPMQFIPSTWSVVGVDGDGDGARDPQDVDDAALATAVYLCSGDDDLSGEQGQRASVYRYNHSNDYVDLVLSIMQAYLDGDFAAVPTSSVTSGTTPGTSDGDRGGKDADKGDRDDGTRGGQQEPQPTKTPTQQPTQTPTTQPTQTPTSQPTQTPTSQPTQTPTTEPTQTPTTPTTVPTLPVPTTVPTVPVPTIVPEVLTPLQAQVQCLADGLLLGTPALQECIDRLLNP